MTIDGRVVALLPEQTGQGKNGTWRKGGFVIETPGEYPKQVAVQVWGDRIEEFGVRPGEQVVCHINIQSREYNGKWYTDIEAWKLDREAGAPTHAASEADLGGAPDDGLPF